MATMTISKPSSPHHLRCRLHTHPNLDAILTERLAHRPFKIFLQVIS